MKNRKRDTRWLVSVALMAAIVVLLANTPLGMIQLPIIKATTTHIPVILGAILLGPMAGAILGGVFGLCSLVSNTIAPVAASVCFSPFIAISLGGPLSAVKALWVSVGCRILIGVVAGWLWLGVRHVRLRHGDGDRRGRDGSHCRRGAGDRHRKGAAEAEAPRAQRGLNYG